MPNQNSGLAPDTRGPRSMGAILIDSGRISADAAEQILRAQKEKGMRFGDAGLALGLLTNEDIQFALARQFDYPYVTATDSLLSRDLVAAFKPFNSEVETLRALRSQLMLRWFDGDPTRKCMAIVSPGRKEGRSYLAANLAIVTSQLGERTLLIDADLRYPVQHRLFGVQPRFGLSDILSERASPADCVEKIASLRALSVLSAGAVPPNPQELLSRAQFSELLRKLSGDFDIIVIDTPASATTADAQIIAGRAGAALVLARRNMTSAPQLTRLVDDLGQGNAAVVGSVLTDF